MKPLQGKLDCSVGASVLLPPLPLPGRTVESAKLRQQSLPKSAGIAGGQKQTSEETHYQNKGRSARVRQPISSPPSRPQDLRASPPESATQSARNPPADGASVRQVRQSPPESARNPPWRTPSTSATLLDSDCPPGKRPLHWPHRCCATRVFPLPLHRSRLGHGDPGATVFIVH